MRKEYSYALLLEMRIIITFVESHLKVSIKIENNNTLWPRVDGMESHVGMETKRYLSTGCQTQWGASKWQTTSSLGKKKKRMRTCTYHFIKNAFTKDMWQN